jgi:hypothetical protein
MNQYNLVASQIADLTTQKMYAIQKNVLEETLRQMIHIFGNIWYLDPNNNKVKIHCSTSKMDRVTGKNTQENTLVLPYITVNEAGITYSDGRRRSANLLISESFWDAKEKRAKRVLSLPPIAVDINYEINIWSKFVEDLDTIRLSIFSLFNPDLTIRTKFSDLNRSFIESETDISDYQATDTADRTLKKTITIKVETYLPAPKFLYTNSGQLVSFNAQFEVFNQIDNMKTDLPVETVISSKIFN